MKNARELGALFFGRLVANLVEVALGVFPNGLADYKGPSDHRA